MLAHTIQRKAANVMMLMPMIRQCLAYRAGTLTKPLKRARLAPTGREEPGPLCQGVWVMVGLIVLGICGGTQYAAWVCGKRGRQGRTQQLRDGKEGTACRACTRRGPACST